MKITRSFLEQKLELDCCMSNKILVVGASSDIGLELMKSGKAGDLFLAHFNENKKMIEIAAQDSDSVIVPLKCDLSNEENLHELIEHICDDYGFPNKIVHLASSRVENIRFKDLDWKKFNDELDISLRSLVLISKKFLPLMAKEKKGKLVVMLSSYTLGVPPKYLAHYNTCKYAMLGLSKSLAAEFADKNLQINCVSPSMVETKFLSQLNPKIPEINAQKHPLKRNATVEDIVPTIKFLLSSKSNFINGVNIPLSGGEIF